MGTTLSPTDKTWRHRLGWVDLQEQSPVTAGETGVWTLTYTVGSYGIDEGGTIKLAHRFASDWQVPQFDRPGESGYTHVSTTGQARLAARYDPKGHIRPWMKCIVIDVYDGGLKSGDQVTIVLGDRTAGGPGIRAQSFIESAHEFRVFVDPTNACLTRAVPNCPTVPVVAGSAVKIVCVLPTQTTVGLPTPIRLRGEDRWGNPTTLSQQPRLQWIGDNQANLERNQLTLYQPGTGYLQAQLGELVGQSNPMTAYENPPLHGKYWADLHAQTDATVGTGTEEEYFTFGRDAAFLDIISHQGNDFQMTDEDWCRLNATTKRFHKNGRYIVLPGYEWSANTSAGGDHNVFYLEEGLPILRSSHWQIPQTPEDEMTPAHPLGAFFSAVRQHVPLEKVLVGSHVGGRYADLSQPLDDELAPLVELVSCWGVFEWMLFDALKQGYTVGVMANSDGHKGRPGAEGPGAGEWGIANGLTCVLAESLTRQAVFDALKQRRCYGTSGPRIDLGLTVNDEPMGSVIKTDSSVVHVEAQAVGAAPLESLQLFVGTTPAVTIQPNAFEDVSASSRIRVQWGGARMRGRGRRVVWDGQLTVSGAKIQQFEPFAFDSPADSIQKQDQCTLSVRSRTTGDIDGVDLYLDQPQQAMVCFTSQAGKAIADATQLNRGPVRVDLGGMGMHIAIRRYPQHPMQRSLRLQQTVNLPTAAKHPVPIFAKVTQVDGHMAWSSPVYART